MGPQTIENPPEPSVGAADGTPDVQAFANYRAERDEVIKKHGFKNFAEYEVVAANILVVMAGIDPQTKLFTDPQTAIKKEIEAVRADKTIRNSEKKQIWKSSMRHSNQHSLSNFPPTSSS